MMLWSPFLPDDAGDECSDEEDEEDGGKDHDDRDARTLVQVRHQARPRDHGPAPRVVIVVA